MFNSEGLINIDEFIMKKYSYKYNGSISTLMHQPFIETELDGSSALFWIIDGNDRYLFKKLNGGLDYAYGEFLSQEYLNLLGLEHASYRLGKLGNMYGILSKNFLKEDEVIISGNFIFQSVLDNYKYLKKPSIYEDKDFTDLYNVPEGILKLKDDMKGRYLVNNLNNLEQIWNILSLYFEEKYGTKKDKCVKDVMDYLVKLFMFDVLSIQADRHVSSWGYIESLNGMRTLPIYDNSASFGLELESDIDSRIKIFNEMVEGAKASNKSMAVDQLVNYYYKRRLQLTVSEENIKNAIAKKRETNIKIIESFLKISSEETIELFLEYYHIFETNNIEDVIKKCESVMGVNIKDNVKKYIIDGYNLNLSLVKGVLESYSKGVSYGK